jgi:DNA-binding MarR family transcriptional regulator
MTLRVGSRRTIDALERVATASVAVTGRALGQVAPELTFLQWRVLVVVGGEADGLPVSDVARQVGSKLPAMSRLLGRLRRRDLVDSDKVSADARLTVVRLTPAGRALRDDVIRRRRDLLSAGAQRAGVGRAMASDLERVALALEGIS